ncbi:unnamed protein product [Hydatigera taeniaeformis]|uniref:DEP domain-containing protein n=1 Tax=Hydatigena taeniaeformis TaxID=6205 RepID=A0A0R3WK69_HYDTA|nr:unnamed protein product [Hydatigera taeniaeformis]
MNTNSLIPSYSADNFTTFGTHANASFIANATNTSTTYNHVFAGITSVFLTIYVLIILGFFVGHFRLLSKAQIRGFGRFVHRYAISALIFIVSPYFFTSFNTTVTIRLESIQWPAIWSIFISRFLMLIVSTTACLVISRGQFVGLSAIVSLLLTDSNDIAVMYPTFRILHPSMASHCCIVVALQILLLKPIAFLLLELSTFRERQIILRDVVPTAFPSSMTLRTPFKILCQVLLDPQLIAFCLGLLCNVAFRNQPPISLTHFSNTFDVAFTACALFYLGLVCVNVGTGVSEKEKPLLAAILSLKVSVPTEMAFKLVMPILARKFYNLLPAHTYNETTETFVLLYSLSPASATLLPLASRYAVAPNLVGDSIRTGTFLLLPCLFVYECVIFLLSADPSIYAHFLEKTAVYISWISAISGVSTSLGIPWFCSHITAQLIESFISKNFLFFLSLTALDEGGVSSWSKNGSNASPIRDLLSGLHYIYHQYPAARITLADYIKFSFYLSAYYCTRMWTAFICIGMLIQQREARLMPRRNRTVFYIFGLLAPILLTVSMKIISHDVRHQDVNPFHRYGTVQRSVFFRRKFARSAKNGYAPLANGSVVHEGVTEVAVACAHSEFIPLTVSIEKDEETERSERDNVDQSPTQREESEFTVDPNNKDGQIHRHYAVVCLNLVGMVFGMCGCLWRLMYLRISTTVMALEFMDQVFNFGQGFLVFSLYGLDVEYISRPLLLMQVFSGVLFSCSKFRERVSIWFLALKRPGRQRIEAESGEGGELRVKLPTRQTSGWRIAESFALLHLDACVSEICKPILLPTREVKRAFVLADFQMWLLKRNICTNLNEVLSLLLSLELNDYVRGLSVTSVYALDPESCDQNVFEFTLLD